MPRKSVTTVVVSTVTVVSGHVITLITGCRFATVITLVIVFFFTTALTKVATERCRRTVIYKPQAMLSCIKQSTNYKRKSNS